jgi:tetratricopeptide (TPR) repeat protein
MKSPSRLWDARRSLGTASGHPIENPNRIFEYLRMTPENEKLINVAIGYFELGMLDEAVTELGPLPGDERLSVLSLWNSALRLSERWSEMLSLSRKMIELYPAEAECWVSLADATRNSVSVQAGLELLETAREQFPSDEHILFQIGCYCCQLGRLDEARTAVYAAVSSNRVWANIALEDRDLTPLWPELKARSSR